MQIAIANTINGSLALGGGSTPVAPDYVYSLGESGELDGGIIYYYYDGLWYETHPSESFFYLDFSLYSPATILGFDIQKIEDLFNSEEILGVTGWKVVTEPNPNSLGFIGFDTHEYDTSNGIMDSMLSPEILTSLLTDIAASIVNGTASEYKYIRILYKEYNTVSVLEIDYPQSIFTAPKINVGSNWNRINLNDSLLGATLYLDSQLSESKIRYYVARSISYEGPSMPEQVIIPPSHINVYDQPVQGTAFPNGILPNVILAYGDVLEAQRLSKTIDRYRETPQIQSTPTPTKGLASELSVMDFYYQGFSQVVSVQSANKQLVLKLYIIQQDKPPSPWYDKLEGEVLSAAVKLNCFKNSSSSTTNLLSALGWAGEQPELTSESSSITLDNIVLNGITYYTALHTFLFDVSNVIIGLTAEEQSAIGAEENRGVVTDLQYVGTSDPNVSIKMRSMLFEVTKLNFFTNKRARTRNLSNVIKTGQRVVIPTIGGAIAVGADASAYILEPTTTELGASGSLYLSMREGEVAPERNYNGFEFAFDLLQPEDKPSSFSPALNFVNVKFDTLQGAIDKDSVFNFIGGSNQTVTFSGNVLVSVLSGTATLNLKLSINFNILVDLGDPVVTTAGGYDTFSFTIDYTHTFTGNTAFNILETAKLALQASDREVGELLPYSLLATSSFSAEPVAFDASAPVSDPATLLTPIAPIKRFTRY